MQNAQVQDNRMTIPEMVKQDERIIKTFHRTVTQKQNESKPDKV